MDADPGVRNERLQRGEIHIASQTPPPCTPESARSNSGGGMNNVRGVLVVGVCFMTTTRSSFHPALLGQAMFSFCLPQILNLQKLTEGRFSPELEKKKKLSSNPKK